MKQRGNFKSKLIAVVIIITIISFWGAANAMEIEHRKGAKIDCDVTVTYGGGWRVSDRDKEKLADVNADDGNLNFEQWDMVTNKVSLLADIDIQYRDVGVFIRPKAFYDQVYMSDNSNSTDGSTNNAFVGGLINEVDEWADDIEDVHGRVAEILDVFSYASADIGGHYLEIRVGRQMINWGKACLSQAVSHPR